MNYELERNGDFSTKNKSYNDIDIIDIKKP